MFALTDEIKQSLALSARNRLYGILREAEALGEQDKEATAYWRVAIHTRLSVLKRDAIYWAMVYERYSKRKLTDGDL